MRRPGSWRPWPRVAPAFCPTRGVRLLLAGLPLNDVILRLDPGHVFEQWVLAELHQRCLVHGRGYRLSAWRTSTGAQVDAILETPDEVIPVEVKWTERPAPSDARHVERFLDLHQELAHRGFVVRRCARKQALTKRATALPWDRL